MKKEYFIITAIAFFALAYVLDYFAGPISLSLTNPLIFLTKSYLNNYPLTAFAVAVRSLGIFISLVLLASVIDKQYFVKAFTFFVIAVLSELYAVQQLATGMRTTSLQWTLSISYAGINMVAAIAYYTVVGVIYYIKNRIDKSDGKKNGSNAAWTTHTVVKTESDNSAN